MSKPKSVSRKLQPNLNESTALSAILKHINKSKEASLERHELKVKAGYFELNKTINTEGVVYE